MTTTQPTDDALDVLRAVWQGQGQGKDDIDEACGITTPCKNMGDVGFQGLADESGDVKSAWRETLAREGKLGHEGKSLHDVVFGSQEEN